MRSADQGVLFWNERILNETPYADKYYMFYTLKSVST